MLVVASYPLNHPALPFTPQFVTMYSINSRYQNKRLQVILNIDLHVLQLSSINYSTFEVDI